MNLNSVFLLAFLFCHASIYAGQIFEAENSILTNGAVSVANAASSGGFYVAQREGQLYFEMSVEDTGYYNIYINTASPHGEKKNILAVNDATLIFGTNHHETFVKLLLVSGHKISAGKMILEIRKSWGWINIDNIALERVEKTETSSLIQTLVNPSPSPETTALYDFILDNYGSKLISGVMTLNSMDEAEWLKINTGKEPALIGIDLMHSGRNYDWYDDQIPIQDAVKWYKRNGIPALMWHWRDPSRATEEFYTSGTSFDVSKVLDENSVEYEALLKDIDFIAELFKTLQLNEVPVLWRPLHEAAGGWFWWGAHGPEPCKKLYQLMYDRMVHHHGLNNLIWVWTREPNDDAWYPGDEYVDMVGRDIYKTGDHSSQGLEFNHMKQGNNKMLALSECGSFPAVENLVSDEISWSWFMPWYGKYTRDATYNSIELWRKTLSHEYVITLDEMPVLKTYKRQAPEIVAGLNEQLSTAKIYPTLVKDELTVESSYLIRSLIIYSSSGVRVFELRPMTYATRLAFHELQPGMYYVNVNHQRTVKVVKQ